MQVNACSSLCKWVSPQMREIFSYLFTPIFVITRFTLGLMWGNTVILSPHGRHWLNNSRHSPLSVGLSLEQLLPRSGEWRQPERNRHPSNLDWSVTKEDWKCVSSPNICLLSQPKMGVFTKISLYTAPLFKGSVKCGFLLCLCGTCQQGQGWILWGAHCRATPSHSHLFIFTMSAPGGWREVTSWLWRTGAGSHHRGVDTGLERRGDTRDDTGVLNLRTHPWCQSTMQWSISTFENRVYRYNLCLLKYSE